MFNPRPVVSQLPIGGGAVCIVLDQALAEPQALVDLAARHRDAFVMAEGNAFPGLELPLPDSATAAFAELFSQHARTLLGARRVLSASGRLSMVTLRAAELAPLQRVCHRDRLAAAGDECVGAAVLYLFDDAALGGTGFFEPRGTPAQAQALMQRLGKIDNAELTRQTGWPPGYMTRSNQYFELTGHVPARRNRLIFYDGSRFHSSHIERPDLLSDDPTRGRLTLNLFFLCRRRAAAGP